MTALGGAGRARTDPGQLPVTVIGGYLGAGKTTLLNHLLTNARGLRVAALVNDFGSVNVDLDLVAEHDGETLSLANGCICCSLVNGFAQTIGGILRRAGSFDHIVIEASGVALPARVGEYGQMYQLPLDGVLVVVDAEQIRVRAADKYVGDTVLRQLAQADLLIVNKTDLVPAGDLAALRSWLGGHAPGTPLIETVRSEVPLDLLLGAWTGAPPDAHPDDAEQPRHGGQAHQTWTLAHDRPLTRDDVERFATGLGADIYRVKGFVHLAEDPGRRYVYQQVGRRWSLTPEAPWDAEPPRSLLVAIGRAGSTGDAPDVLSRIGAA